VSGILGIQVVEAGVVVGSMRDVGTESNDWRGQG
jgi:hypothetical protein